MKFKVISIKDEGECVWYDFIVMRYCIILFSWNVK